MEYVPYRGLLLLIDLHEPIAAVDSFPIVQHDSEVLLSSYQRDLAFDPIANVLYRTKFEQLQQPLRCVVHDPWRNHCYQ